MAQQLEFTPFAPGDYLPRGEYLFYVRGTIQKGYALDGEPALSAGCSFDSEDVTGYCPEPEVTWPSN